MPIFQKSAELTVQTEGRKLYDITQLVKEWLSLFPLQEGLLTLYIRHTSASLVIQENDDPEVLRDMERFFNQLVPQGNPLFKHTAEGPDDMPAHIRAALTAVSLSIPINHGALLLGTWQGIFLYEHRSAMHTRVISCHLIGA